MQEQLATGALVKVAGGGDDAALHLNQAGAELWIARAPAGAALTIPDAAHVHVVRRARRRDVRRHRSTRHRVMRSGSPTPGRAR